MSGYNFRGRANTSKRRSKRRANSSEKQVYGFVGLVNEAPKLFKVKGIDYDEARKIFDDKYMPKGIVFEHSLGTSRSNTISRRYRGYLKGRDTNA
jgi:hypothetical protein